VKPLSVTIVDVAPVARSTFIGISLRKRIVELMHAAARRVRQLIPYWLALSVEISRTNGPSFLSGIPMEQLPIPVVFTQVETTSVACGMPSGAIKLGTVNRVLPFPAIAVLEACR